MNERNIENFRKEVIEYNEIDIMIKKVKQKMEPLKIGLKKLTEKKKELQQCISSFMSTNDLSVCNFPKEIDNGAIKYTFSEAPVPMTKDNIKNVLTLFYTSGAHMSEEFLKVPDEEKGQYVFKYIQENRPKVPKETIRRVKHANMDEIKHEYEILEQI